MELFPEQVLGGHPLAKDYGRAVTVARATAAVLIPTDFATIQAAIDYFGPSPKEVIEIRLVGGHRPLSGFKATEGDYSRYIITAEVQSTAFIGLNGTYSPTVGSTVTQTGSGASGEVVSIGGYQNKILLLGNVSGTFNTTGALSFGGTPVYVKHNVVLIPSWTTSTNAFIDGVNAELPQLSCLLASAGKTTSLHFGYRAIGQSKGTVAVYCGAMGCWQDGCRSYLGADVTLESIYPTTANGNISAGAVFSWNAQNNTTSSNVVAWAATLTAEYLDFKFSGYYGGQAAHSGHANFQFADASDAFRYGVRGSDEGTVNVNAMKADRCGIYGFYAFEGSHLSGEGVSAINCGSYGAAGSGVSTLNLGTATLSGGTGGLYASAGASVTVDGGDVYGIVAGGGASVVATGCNCQRVIGTDSPTDIIVQQGGKVTIDSASDGGWCQPLNLQTSEGIIQNGNLTDMSSPSLGANVENWAISIDSYSLFNIASTTNRSIGGIVRPTKTSMSTSGVFSTAAFFGRRIMLVNPGVSTLTLLHESGNSLPENRFALPGGTNWTLGPNEAVWLTYTSDRWRIVTG